MAKGYFNVHMNKDIDFDIVCALHGENAKSEIPEKQQELYVQIEETNNIIKSLLYTDDETKLEYSKKLLSLAQVGLVGETAQPELSKKSLIKLKEEILISEGGRIKNKHFNKLGVRALIIGIIAVALGFFLYSFAFTDISAYFFVFSGAMAGAWISFGVRKLDITFEDLALMEKDRIKSFPKLFFVGVTSIILMLFINSSFVSFEFGGITNVEIMGKIELQLLVGVIAGMLENKLAVGLYGTAKKTLNIDLD